MNLESTELPPIHNYGGLMNLAKIAITLLRVEKCSEIISDWLLAAIVGA